MNNTVQIGRLTKDLDLQYTKADKAVVKFTLAVARKYNRDETDFIRCVAWEKTAEKMKKYVGKGSLIGIEGSIQTGSYDKDDGTRVYTTEVICQFVQFLESKKDKQSFNDTVHEEINKKSTVDDEEKENLPF